MSCLTTTVTPLHISSTNIALMTRSTTLETYNPSRRISPTSLMTMSNSLLPLTSIIWFLTALLILAPLLINNTIMSVVVLLINPTTINQINKNTNLLVTDRFLDFWTQPILKLDTLGKLTIRTIIVLVKLSQLTKLDRKSTRLNSSHTI